MTASSKAPFRNNLLASLAGPDLEAVARLLEPATLAMNEVIERPNEPVPYAYFPESGIASVIATDGVKRRMEAGPFGREGMSGIPLILATDRSPLETVVQLPGTAHRIAADDLRRLLIDRPTIRDVFARYAQAFTVQTAHTALSAALAVVELRLARWILMLHDRVDGDEMSITHEFIALMLAVRRPGVTVALHELEGRGLIRSTRGRLIVRDRAKLEKMCGGFYGGPEAEYARLIGTTDASKSIR
jgi:CRP-like cAMP-binding protein